MKPLLCLLAFAVAAIAAPVDVSTRVQVTSAGAKSTLDRATSRITSTVEVTLKNIGDRALGEPITAAVDFTAQSGTLAGLLVPGAQGGPGTFVFDLSSANPGDSLAAGASVTFTLRFTPAAGARVTYAVRTFAELNSDPVANVGGPYAAQAGQQIGFNAAASTDPDGDAVTFMWDFGDGATATGAAPSHAYATPGAYEAVLTVRDARGAQKVARVPVAVSPAAAFALARVRALDGAGLPLGGVTVEETLDGAAQSFAAHPTSGFTSLGRGVGAYVWKFSKPGHLDVWRSGALTTGNVALVPNPWLARRTTPTTTSPLNDTAFAAPGVALTFPAEAFPQPVEAALTALNTQGLPFPLPAGWSPLAQFHFQSTIEPAAPGTATLTLRGPIPAGEDAALVRFNAAELRWDVIELVAGTSVPVASSGTFALVLPDLGAAAPPAAVAGQPLAGTTAPADLSGVTATGTVTPAVSAASRDAAQVTASARVAFTNPASAPSGQFFRTRVTESYDLANGGKARAPDYDTTVFAYQRPGGFGADFPLRPRLLFGPQELAQAIVRSEILAPAAFAGGVIDATGGALGQGGVRATVPPSAVTAAQAAEIGTLDPAGFAGFTGVAPVKAFALNIGALAPGTRIGFAFDPAAPNGFYVLGLVVSDGTQLGITPLERFTSDATGQLTSAEPATGPRLPGATGPGDYVLLAVPGPQALVQGIARGTDGQPAAGLAVRAAGQPWLVFSTADGSYTTLAPVGTTQIALTDPRDGNQGFASVTVSDPAQPQTANLSAAPTGPRVASVDPANNATNVRRVTPIIITFTEPVTTASFGGDGVVLRDSTSAAVPASLSLNLSGTVATLLPANPLAANAAHSIEVSAALKDATGLAIEGDRVFTFTTAPDAPRDAAAQLVIYEPGAANVPAEALIGYNPARDKDIVVVQGTAGVADPSVAVILVNEATSETATVLSKADGSFVSHIRADAADLISMTFVNANGTRVNVPAARQLFDDGRVGLYRAGGILEAQSDGGPVQVIIEPETVGERAVFKLESVGLAELLASVQGEIPQDTQLLAGVRLTAEGELKKSVDLSFPVDAGSLNLPPGMAPEDASFTVAQPDSFNGTPIFNVVDKATFADGKVRTASPPFGGVVPPLPGAASAVVPFMLFYVTKSIAVITGNVVAVPEGTTPAEYAGSKVFNRVGTGPTNFQLIEGAIVSAGSQDSTSGLSRGAFSVRANRNGFYAIQVPIQGSLEAVGMQAFSFRFPNQVARGVAITGGIPGVGAEVRLANVAFFKPVDGAGQSDTLAPFSTLDAPGYLPVDQLVSVFVQSFDNMTAPQILAADWVRCPPGAPANTKCSRSLLDGLPLENADVSFRQHLTLPLGTTGVRTEFEFRVKKPAKVFLKVNVGDAAGNTREFIFPLEFRPAPPQPPGNITPTDPNDSTQPTVLSVVPGGGATVTVGEDILVNFSEAISLSIEANDSVLATGSISSALETTVDLSPDQLSARVKLSAAMPGEEITLIFTSAVVDLSGNALVPHTEVYRTAPTLTKTFNTVGVVAAVADAGSRSVVIERIGADDGRIAIFRQGIDLQPVEAEGSLSLPPFPRTLALVENYEFRRHPSMAPEKKTLAVVAGGLLGDEQIGTWMWVVDITDPANPSRVAASLVNVDFAANITKMEVDRGVIYAAVNTAGQPFIQTINLQAFILGSNLLAGEFAAAGAEFAGTDLLSDGDYVDPGDQLPKPSRNQVPGLTLTIPLAQDTFLNDFDIDSETATLCVVLRAIKAGELSRYQTVLLGGDIIGLGAQGDPGGVVFPAGTSPFRVIIDRDVRVSTPTGPKTVALAAIVASSNTLLIYDIITNPLSPQIVESVQFPPGTTSILHLSKSGGNYVAATGSTTFVISKAKLVDNALLSNLTAASPAIILSAKVGSLGRNLGVTTFHLTGIVDGKLQRVLLPPPISMLRIVATPLLNVFDFTQQDETSKQNVLSQAAVQDFLFPSRLGSLGAQFPGALATPAPPERYNYVRIEINGDAGRIIELAIDATDGRGKRLPPRGKNHAPVILTASPGTAGVDGGRQPNVNSQRAYRLSNDINSPLYNVYLSTPFVLTGDAFSDAIVADLQGFSGRQGVQVGEYLRVAIETADNPAVLGPLLTPSPRLANVSPTGVSRSFPSFCGDFLDSPNPGATDASPAVHGVSLQSGEFRYGTADLLVETPAQPITLQRTYESGTHSAGIFGRGWDFNFGMRLCEIPGTAVGYTLPLTIYGDPARDEVATAGDLLMHTGSGDLRLFRLISPLRNNLALRPLFEADPAIAQFGFTGKIVSFYQPPPGSFDMLLKLVDGVFVLVDGIGTQTFFRPDGRLERIQYPYAASRTVLSYRADGRLDKVTGDGGTTIRFGYFDFVASSAFVLGQDLPLSDNAHAGLIARVISGADEVKYTYDASGNLTKVEGLIADAIYGYDPNPPHQLTSIGRDNGGKPPGQKIHYTDGVVTSVEVDGVTTAFGGSAKTAAARFAQPNGSATVMPAGGGGGTSFEVDKFGQGKKIAGKQVTFNDQGQLMSLGDPADGFEVVYDAANLAFRFRGNVLQVKQGTSRIKDTYDGSAWNRLLERENAEGIKTTYTHGGVPGGTIVETTGTRARTANFNTFGTLTNESVGEGGTSFTRTVLFDADGRPNAMKLGSDITWSFGRGANNGVNSVQLGTLGFSPSFSPEGQFMGTGAGGASFTLGHDASGFINTAGVSAGTGSYEHTLSYAGGTPGRLASVAVSETGVPAQNVDFGYDGSGQVASSTRNGVATQLTYSGTRASTFREPGTSRSVTFDGEGRPKTVTEQGITSTMTYNGDGRLSTAAAQGATHTYSYGMGNQLSTHTVTDPQGGTALSESFTYDTVGRIATVAVDGATYSFDYFPDDSPRKTSVNGAMRHEFEKNAAGLTTKVTFLGGALETSFTNFDPTSARPMQITRKLLDGTTLSRINSYDSVGRLKTITEPNGVTRSIDYDDFGRPKKDTDADGVSVQATFTPTGLPLSRTFGDGTTVSYTYNNDLTIHTKGGVTFSYDAELMPSRIEYADGTRDEYLNRNALMLPQQTKLGSLTQSLGYTDGRLSSMSAGADSMTFTHDALGRAREITRGAQFVRYAYSNVTGVLSEESSLGAWSVTADPLGRISTETYPSGASFSWNPDATGLPTASAQVGIQQIEWRDLDLPKRVKFAGGVEIAWTFDAASRVTGLRYRNASGDIVAGFDYALTPGGRVLSETRMHEAASDVFTHNAPAMGMRVNGVLFSAASPQATTSPVSISGIAFDGDSEIDWSAIIRNGVATRTITPDPADAFVFNDHGSADEGPIWVNLAGFPQKFPAKFYYDGFGYLRKVERIEAGDVTVTVEYTRDGRGRIVRRNVTGPIDKCVPGERAYAWKDDQLLEEYDVPPAGPPTLRCRYVYLGDNLILVQRDLGAGVQSFIPLTGLTGSVGGFLDATGAIVEFTRFGLFGLPEHVGLVSGALSARSGISGTLQFHGAFFDEETGLYTMGSRTLHPVFGRFLERDSDYYADSRAFYTAFNGDPASFVDSAGTATREPTGTRASRVSLLLDEMANGHVADEGGGLEILNSRGDKFFVSKNSKAFGFSSKLVEGAAGLFPGEREQEALKAFAVVLDLAKHTFKTVEEFQDFSKTKTDLLKATKSVLRAEGPVGRRALTNIKALGVLPANITDPKKLKAIRKAREGFLFARGDRIGNLIGLPKAGVGFAKSIFIDALHLEQHPSRLNYALAGGIEMADAALDFATDFQGQIITTTLLRLSAGSPALQSGIVRRFSIGGGFLDVGHSSFFARANAAYGAYTLSYGFGKGALTALYGLADPGAAQEYLQTVQMFEQDGGYLGFRTVGGIMLSAGVLSDETAFKLNDLSDFSLGEFIEKSRNNPTVELYLRGLDQP